MLMSERTQNAQRSCGAVPSNFVMNRAAVDPRNLTFTKVPKISRQLSSGTHLAVSSLTLMALAARSPQSFAQREERERLLI